MRKCGCERLARGLSGRISSRPRCRISAPGNLPRCRIPHDEIFGTLRVKTSVRLDLGLVSRLTYGGRNSVASHVCGYEVYYDGAGSSVLSGDASGEGCEIGPKWHVFILEHKRI